MRGFLVATALLLPLMSCAARRTLLVTTEPEGATVRLDDKTVGTTPLEIPFEHYGVRRVTLYKEGYLTHSEQVELDTPWYFRFPVDLVSEILLPFGWKDERHYHLELIEGTQNPNDPALWSVIERAQYLRHAGPEGPTQMPEAEPREVPPLIEEEEESPPEETEGKEPEPDDPER